MKWNLPYFETQVAGVELALNPDGNIAIHTVVLKKAGSKIETVACLADLKSTNELATAIDKGYPVLLSLKGKGIIHKKINNGATDSWEVLLDKVLPNSSLQDFYVQKLAIDEQQALVSVARKSVIDGAINEITGQGYSVIACTLGPFAVQSVLPVILPDTETTSELKFANTELLIRQGSIHNYTNTAEAEPEWVAGEGSINIPSNLLVAYASAFAYFNPATSLSGNIAGVQSALVEFKDGLKFKKTGIGLLAFFFTVLLLNFLLFSYYDDKVKEKSARAALSSSELALIDSLSGQVEQRAMFLSKTGLSAPSRTSIYADQIAQSLPEEIRLTSLQIHPQKKDEEDEKKLEFDGSRILVGGSSKFSLDVNEWIRKMRASDWVKSISLLTYKQKDGNRPGEFLIEIKLK
jgi:Tfp pilus assembly protein PilN